jgi:hypothetical protein
MDAKVGHFQSKSFGLFAVALRFCRATAFYLEKRHLVAEMCTLQTDKPTESSCPIASHADTFPFSGVYLLLLFSGMQLAPTAMQHSACHTYSEPYLLSTKASLFEIMHIGLGTDCGVEAI